MNIIITGASSGIGYETAKYLSAEHKIIAISRNTGKLEQLKRNGASENIFPVSFDFENGNITRDLFPEIKKYFRNVDVLINNAATFIKKPFEQTTQEDFQKIFRVNFFSIAELTRVILTLMKNGHVVNIAGMGGIQGSVKFAGLSAYTSSKGALITLTECMAEEYKEKNIYFNAIAFGAVQTKMLERAFPHFKAPVTAKETAKFVAYFAVNGQKYFNGKVLQMALSTP